MADFWLRVLGEVLGEVPVFAAGLWLSHRGLKRHLERTTLRQTGDIAELTQGQTLAIRALTAEQTRQLEDGRNS